MSITKEQVGVGIVGAGMISNTYLENLTSFADIDVRFVADVDVERARDQAEKYGVPRYGSVEELLQDEEIEIVVNLTHPATHVEIALQALAAGKHVWTEKPFALDRASGKHLLETARTAGLRVGTAPDTFLGAGLQSSRRLLESGRIGRPLTALTLLQGPGPENWHPNPDFLFQEGAGPLFDVGPYYLTALVQFFGPVASVSAATSKAKPTRLIEVGPRAGDEIEVRVPTHVAASYTFESGQTAQGVFSFDSKLRRTEFEVAGVDGYLIVPDPNTFEGDLVVWGDEPEPTTIPATGSTTGRGTGVVEMARAIRAGRPERASGELAYHVLDIMVSTIEAGETHLPVQVQSTFTVTPPLPEGWDARAYTLDHQQDETP